MKANRSLMVTAVASIISTVPGLALARTFAKVSLPVLLTVLVFTGACRSVRPPPVDPGNNTGGITSSMGGSGGRAGSGGTGSAGSGGTGGTTVPDANTPETPMDTMPIEVPPACGGTGQACCPGNECNGGGCCELGTCTPFGNSCRLVTSHSCLSNRCGAECGGLKMRCCPQRNCTERLTACEGGGVGTCESCGGMGQACCAGNYCTGSIMCMAGRCGPVPPPDGGPGDAPRDVPRDTPVDAPRG
jgi:hypothetical protein